MTEISENREPNGAQNDCPICGRPKQMARIDGAYLMQQVASVLNFDRGFLYTIRALSIRPGKSVRDFLAEDRNRLVKPIVFLMVASLIYTVSNNIFHFEDSYVKVAADETSAVTSIFKWVQGNYGYANILMAVFIAGWIKLFFRKYDFNIFEILVLLCFIIGMTMLYFSVFGAIQRLTGVELLQKGAVVGFVYLTWAIGQFYGKRKFMHYFKAFWAYMLGMLSFFLVLVMIGLLVDSLA